MQLQILQADASLPHIALVGRLDLQSVSEIQGVSEIEEKFVFNTTTRRAPAVVDIWGIDFIASPGISMLLSAARALRQNVATDRAKAQARLEGQ